MKDFKKKVQAGSVLFILAGLVFFSTEAIAASVWSNPAYQYSRNYISDLGIPVVTEFDGQMINSPLHNVMNFGFIAYGVLFMAAYILVLPVLSGKKKIIGIALAMIYGFGAFLIAIFPGYDWEFQIFHARGAAMMIYGGNLLILITGLLVKSEILKRWFAVLCAILCAAGFAGFFMLINGTFGYKGITERIAVYPIIVWCIIFGTLLFFRFRKKDALDNI
jgi:hypothetical membrane protein